MYYPLDVTDSDTLADIADLAAELGAAPPPEVSRLAPDALADLVATIRERKVEQRRELEEAIGAGLGAVPRLMRAPIRKILFGGRKK